MRPERVDPGPGQESVWDHPRPPALDHSGEHEEMRFAGVVIADTRDPVRVLETSRGGPLDGPFKGAPGTLGW